MRFDTFLKGLLLILHVLPFNQILDLRSISLELSVYIDEWLRCNKKSYWNFYGHAPSKLVYLCNKFNVPPNRWNVIMQYSTPRLRNIREFCKISSIELIQVPITKDLLKAIKHCKHDVRIFLEGTDAKFIDKLAKLPTIQTLSLINCGLQRCDFSSSYLQKLCISNNPTVTVTKWPTNITDLDISDCNIHELHTLPTSLRTLNISGNKLVQLKPLIGLSLIVFKMSRVWVWGCVELLSNILKPMTNLKVLDMSYTWTGSGILLDVVSPTIEELNISGTGYLNLPDAVEALARLINLKILNLSESEITWGLNLLALQKMTQLNSLSLRSLYTGGSTGNSLKIALMHKNNLETVDFSSCGYTLTYVLDSLCYCKRLRSLNISDNNFEDISDSNALINALSQLKLIKIFTCKNSRVDYATIEKILDTINILVENIDLTNSIFNDIDAFGRPFGLLEKLLVKFQRLPNLKIGLVSNSLNEHKLYAHLSKVISNRYFEEVQPYAPAKHLHQVS
jgi:hypothetical protein